MAKNTNTTKTARAAAPKASALDWTKEGATIEQAAREKGGSRGDLLGKIGKLVQTEGAGADLIRARCGEAGARLLIDQPRNVLAKLPRLATCIAAGTSYCSVEGLAPTGIRKEDASVPVALRSLGAGNERQKAVIADAAGRYAGGANAQMGAALEALVFFGIADREPGSARNATYKLADKAAADKLMPTA